MSFKLEIKGLDATIQKVENIAKNAKQEMKYELTQFAVDVTRDAKSTLQRNGTSNTGALANSINWDVIGLDATITVAKKYAAFIEFGTRKFAAAYVASLPADWQTYAATFKGGSGSFDDFLRSILQWIKDRGIQPRPRQFEQGDSYSAGKLRKPRIKKKVDKEKQLQSLAYAIAIKILRTGIRAQPYLYPAIVKNTPILRQRIVKILSP